VLNRLYRTHIYNSLSVIYTFIIVRCIDKMFIKSITMGINLSKTTIEDNAKVGTVIGRFSISLGEDNKIKNKGDGIEDQVHYKLNNNPYNTFRIDGSDLILNSSLNYPYISNYAITVTATISSGLNISEDFNIMVIFVQQQQATIWIDNFFVGDTNVILNGSQVNTPIGNLWTGGHYNFTYEFVSGPGSTDNKSFRIGDKNMVYTVTDINILTQSSYSIRIRSTDPIGLSIEQALTLIVVIPIQYEPILTTLVNTPKVINLAGSTFDTYPILFKLYQPTMYGQIIQTSSNTFTYTPYQVGIDIVVFIGEVNTPAGEIFSTAPITIEVINYSTSDVSSIPKIQGTYTFDNISYDGNTWIFGTFTSDSPFIQYRYNKYGYLYPISPPVPQNLVSLTELGTMRFIHSVASGDDIDNNVIDGGIGNDDLQQNHGGSN
jgi:hypothetical protein